MVMPFSPSWLRRNAITPPSSDQKQAVAEAVLALSKDLIRRPSISPDDQGCQQVLRERLQQAGFLISDMSRNGVTNTWAVRGSGAKMLVLAGHTDVVQPGPLHLWQTEPFTPTVSDNMLYGRGAADMKTGLAALVIAAERFVKQHPDHAQRLAFAITSDEENIAADGTVVICDWLRQQNDIPDWCLVGEPSSKDKVGDSVRVGRRGSLSCQLTIKGKQGHVAYAQSVINPIHKVNKLVYKLVNKQWDFPSRYFPATSCQMVKFESNSGGMNITPAVAELAFNFRYAPKQSPAKIQKYVANKLQRYQLEHDIRWDHEAAPFLSRNSPLLTATRKVIAAINGVPPILSTAGGTSDGRFFAQLGTHVVELGVSNKTIHQRNESVNLDDLTQLVFIYESILAQLLT